MSRHKNGDRPRRSRASIVAAGGTRATVYVDKSFDVVGVESR